MFIVDSLGPGVPDKKGHLTRLTNMITVVFVKAGEILRLY